MCTVSLMKKHRARDVLGSVTWANLTRCKRGIKWSQIRPLAGASPLCPGLRPDRPFGPEKLSGVAHSTKSLPLATPLAGFGFGFGFYTARDPLVAPAPPGPIRRARISCQNGFIADLPGTEKSAARKTRRDQQKTN